MFTHTRITAPTAGTPARRTRGRAARLAAGLLVAALGVATLTIPSVASAATYDATGVSLKFTQANRSAISPVGATGRTPGDVMKYANVATLGGIPIDAVFTTVSLEGGATLTAFDEGSAVATPPPGSTQSLDDLFMPNMDGVGNPSIVTFDLSFYEGGTYTGAGTGIPVTLRNVKINSYDIDAGGSALQFNDFRGFQTYLTYTQDSTHGLDVLTPGSGMVRFQAKSTPMATATTGSYSWARLQVNYDRVTTLRFKLGATGTAPAYYALDFSAGGTWTTNGTTPVTPTLGTNPANSAPTTADVQVIVSRDEATTLRTEDFPFSDADDNAFAALVVATLPNPADGVLEYYSGGTWTPVTAGQSILTSDLDLGKLRLVAHTANSDFTFRVNDGLVDSAPAEFDVVIAADGVQSIDFPTPETVLGTSSQTIPSNATTTSGLTPTLTSQTPGVCTISGLDIVTAALPSGVNTTICVITATQDGDADFGRAEPVTVQFSVSRLTPQSITFAQPASRELADGSFASGASASSGLTVTLTSLTTDVCTVSGGTITPVALGWCSIRATQAGDGTHAPASPVTRTFEVIKTPQTITFTDPGDDEIRNGTRDLDVSSDGLPPTLTSNTPAVCTVSGTTVTYHGVGECEIVATQAGDGTHAAADPVTRSWQVTKTAQTITFPHPGADEITNGSRDLTVSTDATGLEPTLTSSTPAVCDVTGVTVSYLGAGTCTIVASQTGDDLYEAAADVSRSFLVAKTAQVITFDPLPTRTIEESPIELEATTTAVGLEPVFSSATPAVCTVSGTTLTLVGYGTCQVTASQAGDDSYEAATPVTRTFQVFEVVTRSLPEGQAGEPFETQLEVEGAMGSGTWAAESDLPDGLALDASTGILAGVPTETFDDMVDFSYSEDGATQLVTLGLRLSADAATAGPGDSLANTGREITVPLFAALGLLLAGVIAVVASRRRRILGRHRA